MRSLAEICFRATQEAANAWLWGWHPEPLLNAHCPLLGLPSPREAAELLRSTQFAAEVLGEAKRVMEHRFPLLGIEVATGPEIHWRRDYVNGQETGLEYFRRIPYLDFDRAGDHKVIWELNRHQHLVLLAQAWLFTGDQSFLREIESQLESWLEQNPFQRGINWTSALEVAFRALSWIWTWHCAGDDLRRDLQQRFLTALYHHGCHLEYNLSFYFSPNTHLLGEAVALHAIGVLFPEWPRSRKWAQTGAATVRTELHRQVLSDGAHFEQSSYYHVYALDFFLLHSLLAGSHQDYAPAIGKMAEYLDALLGVPRSIPFLGDDDGGRLFHPYGEHSQYGRATIATASVVLGERRWHHTQQDLYSQAAWWLSGPPAFVNTPVAEAYTPRSRAFFQCGLVELGADDVQVLFDAGPFGARRAGHSHSDTLNLIVRKGNEEILVDSGTYTYVGDPEWRNHFRGSAAHNTVRVDGTDQGQPAGPFGWMTKPHVALVDHAWGDRYDFSRAECSYGGIVLRRAIVLVKPEKLLFILDEINGTGEHLIEQFWHFASEQAAARLMLPAGVAAEHQSGWRSPALGRKVPVPSLCVTVRAALSAVLAAVVDCSENPAAQAQIRIEDTTDATTLVYEGRKPLGVRFDGSAVYVESMSR